MRLTSVTEKTAALAAKLEYYAHKGEVWFTTYKRLFALTKQALERAAKEKQKTVSKCADNLMLNRCCDLL